MTNWVLNCYRNLAVIKPDWTRWQLMAATYRSLSSFIRQRVDVFQLLFFNRYHYQTQIHGKQFLDQAVAGGAVFISVHSGPYTVLGKMWQQHYPGKKLVVTFYHHFKLSVFPIFEKMMTRFGITVIELGGAMKKITPIIESGGSMVLFLDAVLPIERTEQVVMFGKTLPLTTGPYFLAKKFDKPIVPIYTRLDDNVVHVFVLPPIKVGRKSQQTVTRAAAAAVETMIEKTLDQWQVLDKFLLRAPVTDD